LAYDKLFAIFNIYLFNYSESSPSTPKKAKCAKVLFSTGSSPGLPSSSSILLTPSHRRQRAEHSYCKSPSTKLAETLKIKTQLYRARLDIINLKKQVARRDTKIQTLKDALSHLNSISSDQKDHLNQQFPGVLGCLVANQIKLNKVGGKKGVQYSSQIRKFAVTLHFYSPKAYLFMRKHMILPHPHTLSTWMDGSDCGPGFNIRVISGIAEARKNCKREQDLVDVAMTIDEMAIRKEVIWDPKQHKYVGHINFGTGECEGDAPLAGNALVCMISTICGGAKIPIGYVFTDKVDSTQLGAFLTQAFVLMEKYGFNVHTLTADGCAPNVATFKHFGVIEEPVVIRLLSPAETSKKKNKGKRSQSVQILPEEAPYTFDDVVSSFSNPANRSKLVYAVYDVVHMIKLWRNLLAELKSVKWQGGVINFKYIRQLNELQSLENILAANRLSKYHIDFERHKMKVKYAVQALSRSVADALKFCREDLKLSQFKDSKQTENFIYMIDKFFDICNSRHPGQICQKAPISRRNYSDVIEFLRFFCSSILQITVTETRKITTKKDGQKITTIKETDKYLCNSLRKRALIGCIVSAKSIIAVSTNLLYREESPLKYFMTYRISQDLLELFFNKVFIQK
jgi:hypothetical protein